MREKRKMEDVNGIEICGYQKKLLSMHATAYITIKDQSGSTFVVATIKRVINIWFCRCNVQSACKISWWGRQNSIDSNIQISFFQGFLMSSKTVWLKATKWGSFSQKKNEHDRYWRCDSSKSRWDFWQINLSELLFLHLSRTL